MKSFLPNVLLIDPLMDLHKSGLNQLHCVPSAYTNVSNTIWYNVQTNQKKETLKNHTRNDPEVSGEI